MTQPTFLVSDRSASLAAFLPSTRTEKAVLALIGVVVLMQLALVFFKSVNWDEFLHLGLVYDLSEGRLSSGLQTLLARFSGWATLISDDVFDQIMALRAAMLVFEVITIVFVIALSRQFAGREASLLAGLVYVTAGYVFTQAFSYRPDPVSAALLMGALYLFALKQLSWLRVLVIGFLIGLAGALTIKSVFYAPCFAALLWLRLRGGEGWLKGLTEPQALRAVTVPLVALAAFAGVVALHSIGLAAPEDQTAGLWMRIERFVGSGAFQKLKYVFAQAVLSPVLLLAFVNLFPAMKRLSRSERMVVVALLAPLLCLTFYRNTFPYFFTFLLPPICVALAPALEGLIHRFRVLPLVLLAMVTPIFLAAGEPYAILDRQKATIAEAKRLFPEPTGYLAYTSFLPSYPRQFGSLISGVGLKNYVAGGEHLIASNIREGRVAFVLVTNKSLEAVYDPDPSKEYLPQADAQMLRDNFLRYTDVIRILGKTICPRAAAQRVMIYRPGPYSVDGGRIEIDGRALEHGHTVILERGLASITYKSGPCVKLWALDHVPEPPADFPQGDLNSDY